MVQIPLVNRVACAFLFLVPPFLIFGHFIFGDLTIAQDYLSGHYIEPILHAYYNSLGLEPHWDPMRTGGIPYSGNPSAQLFHFPRWFFTKVPGFLTGHALTILLVKHFLLFSFGHAVAHHAIRKLSGLGFAWAYLFGFLMIYNLGSLDSFRYGISIETLIYGICLVLLILLELKEGVSWRLPTIAVLASLAITSSYYPSLILLGLMGGLLIFSQIFLGKLWRTRKKEFLLLPMALFTGLLLSAPNWLQLLDMVRDNYRRTLASTIDWANFEPLRKIGIYFNFFRPWAAEVHSGFGGTSLLALLMAAVFLRLLFDYRKAWIGVLLVFPLVYAMGAEYPAFPFFFHYVPSFKMVRVPGRILEMYGMFVVVLAIFSGLFSGSKETKWAIRGAGVLSLVYLFGALIHDLRYPGIGWKGKEIFAQTPEVLWEGFWDRGSRFAWLGAGVLASSAFAFLNFSEPKSHAQRALFGALVVASFTQAWLVLGHGTWSRERPSDVTLNDLVARDYLHFYSGHKAIRGGADAMEGFASTKFTRFAFAAEKVLNCYYPLNADEADVGLLLPFYLSDQVDCKNSREAIYESMRAEQVCDNSTPIRTYAVTAENSFCGSGGQRASAQGNASLVELNKSMNLVFFTNNLLQVEVNPVRESLFVTRYPWNTNNWQATINGKEAPIVEVNSGFIGLHLKPGLQTVRLLYFSRSAAFGYLLFFAGVALLGALSVWGGGIPAPKWPQAAGFAVVLMALASFAQIQLRRNAAIEIQLPNRYQDVLKKQLERWGGVN